MIAKFRWVTEGISPSIMWHMGPSLGTNGELGRACRVGASSGRQLFMRCEADQRQSPGRDHCGKGSS